MKNELSIRIAVFVLVLSLIYIGINPLLNAKPTKSNIDNSLDLNRKYIQTYFDDDANVPIWEIGDSWVFDIKLSSDYESLFSFNLSIMDLYFEVIDVYNSSYKVEFSGEVIGEISIKEPSIISARLKDAILKGFILIEQDNLGIKRIDSTINGFVLIHAIPQIPFEGQITLVFNPIYDYLDFPIYAGKEWEIPATNISMDLWYQIADVVKSYHFDMPLWKDIAICLGIENITVTVGTFEAFHISSTLGITEYYYAPMIANIIRLFDNDEQLDFVWELKSTTYGGPNKPERPSGVTSGKAGVEYTYETTAIDTDGDQIYYWFDWDDGSNSGWIGLYDSGQIVAASHEWTSQGSYQIKVKAKDVNGAESHWSDPLSISMPKSKLYNDRPFLQQYPLIYQLLQRFLRL